jgi:hypothetical protein
LTVGYLVCANWSALEYEPAIRIAQPLIVKHEVADLAGKLCALPLALPATSLHTFILLKSINRCPGFQVPSGLSPQGLKAQPGTSVPGGQKQLFKELAV